MQLFNTPIPPKAISVARETLPMSDAMHGLQGMTPPNAGMYNSDDGGAMSKPYINAQPSENQALIFVTVPWLIHGVRFFYISHLSAALTGNSHSDYLTRRPRS